MHWIENGGPLTVTVNEHCDELLDVSVAVHVTVVIPSGKAEPEAGTHTVVVAEQSVALGVEYSTVGLQTPSGGCTVMFCGQVICGAVVSLTVTVNVHVDVFCAWSVAVHVTVVVPCGKVEPDAGTHATVAAEHASVAVGVVYVATALQILPRADTVTFGGHVICGPVTSLTVTENVHELLLFDWSVAVHVTVVVPTGKLEPGEGEQTTVGVPHGSVAVGTV